MKFNPDIHHRRSIRLDRHDYALGGTYFVTLVVEARESLFGEIVSGKMQPNFYGDIIREEWVKSASIRAEIELDEWVLMPNHLHGIVIIMVSQGGPPSAPTKPALLGPRPRSLSTLIQGFKSTTAKQINERRGTPGTRVWQRNYYEHIVRDEDDLNRIRFYVQENPLNWGRDSENPTSVANEKPQGRA